MTRVSPRADRFWRVGLLLAIASSQVLAKPSDSPDVSTIGSAAVHARSAALLMSGQEGGELPLNLLPLPDFDCAGEPSLVTAWVEVSGEELLALTGQVGGELHIIAYVLDDAGSVVDRETRRLWIDPSQHSARLLDRGLKVALRMRRADDGGSEIRVLVQWPEGPFGVRVRQLPSLSNPAVGWPPLVPQPDADWAVNRQPAPGRQEVPQIVSSPAPWIPAARPVLRGPTSVYLAVPEPLERASWVVSFTPRTGGQSIDVATERNSVIDTERSAGGVRPERVLDGCVLLSVRFDPSSVPPGVYRMTARTKGGDGLESAALGSTLGLDSTPTPSRLPFVEVIVGDAKSGTFERNPSGFDEQVAQEKKPGDEAEIADPEGSLRAGYREALLGAATFFDENQGVELASFEVTAFAAIGSLVLLERVETRALSILPTEEPTTALATALLHAAAARTHQRYRRIGLVRHSLLRVLRLLQEVETDRDEVGETLGLVGAWALRQGYIDEARELLEQAVGLVPGLNDSQLLLAALEEKTGKHQTALRRLSQLIEQEGFTGLPEARLRYAVNLARVDRFSKAKELLEQIISGSGAAWIRQLAAQEQVRLLRRKDPALAEQKALQALSLWPNQPELLLLVSQLRESTGRFQEARESVEPLAGTAHRTPSPRSRYEQWPNVGAATFSSRVLQTADRQRSVLIEQLTDEI